MIFPPAGQRTGLTLSGVLLIALSIAIGVAAYNAANNILFLALSLLLACLILSGVLSWLNFRGLRWRLHVPSRLRAGAEQVVGLQLRNDKWFLPSYGLWFELELGSSSETHDVPLRGRLDAGSESILETRFVPKKRGSDSLRLNYVGSFFPFGFLRKTVTIDESEDVMVWPATVEYRRFPSDTWQRIHQGTTAARTGEGGDLIGLRRYQSSDSHRQIHWKASARLAQLMVRQNSAEAGQMFSLWVDVSAQSWPRPEQFELLCSLAATLAEDLFKGGKLSRAGVGAEPLRPIRRVSDLEFFFDRLALALPIPVQENLAAPAQPVSRRHLITFAPEGARGVAAYVNGSKTAAA